MGLKGLFKRGAEPDAPPPSKVPTIKDEAMTERSINARSVAVRESSHLEQIRHEVMVNYLFQQQCSTLWIGYEATANEGVMVRRHVGDYLACPPQIIDSVFARGVRALNLPSVITVNSRVVKSYLSWCPHAFEVPVGKGLKVQLLPSMEHLPLARKTHQAAFIDDEGLLVVWDDSRSTNGLRPLLYVTDITCRSEPAFRQGQAHRERDDEHELEQ